MTTCAQNLVMCGTNLVFLLLLLIFCNTLLSYSLVLIRTITTTGSPEHCNIYMVGGYVAVCLEVVNTYGSKQHIMSLIKPI